MTKSLEDYLEAIGFLSEDNKSPRVIDIAKMLGLSKPSVHAALHNLVDRGMIEHKHYGPINLTELGKKKYLELKEKHESLTTFFIKRGVNPENAEKDACAIEHVISDESFEKIQDFMKKNLL